MGPTPPPVEGPKVSCPANQSARTTGRNATVMFPPPTVSGGVAPVTVTCTPPSGSSFPIGSSTSSCVATDAQQRTDRCSFTVTVEAIPLIGATRYVAFGDSITEGKLSNGDITQTPYPVGLKRELETRYTSQVFFVFAEGGGGETTAGGASRLPGVLNGDTPEVLLLLEGVNDLASAGSAGISPMISNLRSMVQQAQGRGIRVFLGTLPPEIPDAQRAGAQPFIVPANDQIRALAGSTGATLVDVYQALIGSLTTFIGPDGLHPTEQGYQMIAKTFFDAVRQRLEVPPTTTFTSLTPPSAPAFSWRGE
jgi:lysophospholipase L1-like esterase